VRPGELASGLLRFRPDFHPHAMSLRTPLTLLLFAAVPAAAQNLTLDISGASAVLVGPNDCTLTSTVNWRIQVTGTACSDLTLWVTSQTTCSTMPAAGDKVLGPVTQSTWLQMGQGSFSLPVTELPALNGGNCPQQGLDQTMRVCGYAKYNALACNGNTDVEVKATQPPTITYDTKAPAVPTIDSVVSLDSALKVNFTVDSDTSQVGVYMGTDPAVLDLVATGLASSGSIRVDGLTNGTLYYVRIYAEDAAGNQSARSEQDFGIPEHTYGFFANYQKYNGAEHGGCSVAPAGACPLLALAWMWARRRRRGAPGLAAAAALAVAPAAWGQMQRPAGEVGTERTMAVEVKLGGYKPLIDEEAGLTNKPYQETFGDNPMILFEVSGERELFQAMGTASVGLSAGYAEKVAPAQKDSGEAASESTMLRVYPLQVFGSYRFDYAAITWGIPVVPYVKLGLHYDIWSSTKGANLESTADGGLALGGKLGWGFTGGLSLLLDVFEPRLARDFDTDAGVNHSYLFAEYHYADVNNFYSAGLNLSGRYFMFGIAFEI